MSSQAGSRILFVAEAITLAQIVRLAALARAIEDVHTVGFASAAFPPLVFEGARFERFELPTVEPERVLAAVRRGRRAYGLEELHAYAAAERGLFARFRPDVVIGDFRLSLAASAPAAGLPLLTLINAYWSPYRSTARFPVPDHPLVRLVGAERAEGGFPLVRRALFAHHAQPVNALRRAHGLGPIGDLQAVLTYGDWTLYPDVPRLAPTQGAPASHRYLGHVPWSPPVPLPEWWSALEPDRPLVYVTLGSSGALDALPAIVEGLSRLPVQVVLTTAGRYTASALPPRFFSAPFVPGERAAARAALVISNGGSTTGYQALAAGAPVLGVASNLDQYLAMTELERVGAGRLVRGGSVSPERIAREVDRALADEGLARAAQSVSVSLRAMDARTELLRVLAEALGARAQEVSR